MIAFVGRKAEPLPAPIFFVGGTGLPDHRKFLELAHWPIKSLGRCWIVAIPDFGLRSWDYAYPIVEAQFLSCWEYYGNIGVIVGGYSQGSVFAEMLASRHPDKVAAIGNAAGVVQGTKLVPGWFAALMERLPTDWGKSLPAMRFGSEQLVALACESQVLAQAKMLMWSMVFAGDRLVQPARSGFHCTDELAERKREHVACIRRPKDLPEDIRHLSTWFPIGHLSGMVPVISPLRKFFVELRRHVAEQPLDRAA